MLPRVGLSKSRRTISATCLQLDTAFAWIADQLSCAFEAVLFETRTGERRGRGPGPCRNGLETLITTTQWLTEGDNRTYIPENPSYLQLQTYKNTPQAVSSRYRHIEQEGVFTFGHPLAIPSHAVPATPAPTKDGMEGRDYKGCETHCEWAGR